MAEPERQAEGAGGVRSALAVLVLFLGALAWFHLGRDASLDGEFQIDEAEWISMGVHSWQLAMTGESVDVAATPEELQQASADPWRAGIQASTFGWMYPSLLKLALGAIAESQDVVTTSRKLYPRFHEGPPRASTAKRNKVKQRFLPALEASRLFIAAFAAGIGVALFAVGRLVAGAVGGGVAYGLWLLCPAVREVAVYVRMDLPPIFFALAALWLVQRHGRAWIGARSLGAAVTVSVVLGLLVGAAVCSKLNGALVSFVVPLWIGALYLELSAEDRPAPWRPVLALILPGAICALMFRASLPGLDWSEPIAAVRDLLDRWSASLATQVKLRDGTPAVPEGAAGRLGLTFARVFGEFDTVAALVGVLSAWVLAPLGLLALVAAALRGPSKSAARALLLFVLVVVPGTALALQLNQRRLLLPVLALSLLLQGVLSGWLWRQVRGRGAAPGPA